MAEPIKKLTEITKPYALRGEIPPDEFEERAEINLKDMGQLAEDLNDDFIPKVNDIIEQINPIVQNSEAIVAVGQNIDDVEAVAASITSVVTAADNMAAIKAAPAAAMNAATSATAAATSETNAVQSADSAGTDAALAETAKDESERIKYEVEQIQAGLLEGASVAPVPGTPVLRDAYGRSQMEAPVADKDIANRKWALDTLNSALENFSSGLKVPVAINLESELPDASTAEEGDNYAIENMDITAPNQQGHAWYNPEASTTEWQKIVVQMRAPDGQNIILDADGKMDLSDEVKATLGKVNPIDERVMAFVGAQVEFPESATPGRSFTKLNGQSLKQADYPALFSVYGRRYTLVNAPAGTFNVPVVASAGMVEPGVSEPQAITDMVGRISGLSLSYVADSRTIFNPIDGYWYTYFRNPGSGPTASVMNYITRWYKNPEGKIEIVKTFIGTAVQAGQLNDFWFSETFNTFYTFSGTAMQQITLNETGNNFTVTSMSGASVNPVALAGSVFLDDHTTLLWAGGAAYQYQIQRQKLATAASFSGRSQLVPAPQLWMGGALTNGIHIKLSNNRLYTMRTRSATYNEEFIIAYDPDNMSGFSIEYIGSNDLFTSAEYPCAIDYVQVDPATDTFMCFYKGPPYAAVSSPRMYQAYELTFKNNTPQWTRIPRADALMQGPYVTSGAQMLAPAFIDGELIALSTDTDTVPAQRWGMSNRSEDLLPYVFNGK